MSDVQPELIAKAKMEEDFKRIAERQEIERQLLRQKFISALKSGKYLQVRRNLRMPVLRLMPPAFRPLRAWSPPALIATNPLETRTEMGYCAIGLAYEVMGGTWNEHGGWVYEMVRQGYRLRVAEVVQLNDQGWSFERIAHELETNPWPYWMTSGE